MSEMVTAENKKLKNLRPWKKGQAPKSPGRPRIPPEQKAERKALKDMLREIAPAAISTLNQSLGSDDERNRLRASEIILSHTVPKLSEGVIDLATTPLTPLPDNAITEILADALATGSPTPAQNGDSGNGEPS